MTDGNIEKINTTDINRYITPGTEHILSVLIPAWKTQDYIEECLDGIYASDYILEGNPVNVIVGVDGCPDTLAKLEELATGKYKDKEGFVILYSKKNNGVYITRNGLIDYAPEGWILLFDSDDILHVEVIGQLMEGKQRGFFDAHGRMFMEKQWFIRKIGGFMPWKCAADTELVERAATIGDVFATLTPPYSFRREHPNQLTKTKGTNMRSALRKMYYIYINQKHTGKITPELPEFVKVYPK